MKVKDTRCYPYRGYPPTKKARQRHRELCPNSAWVLSCPAELCEQLSGQNNQPKSNNSQKTVLIINTEKMTTLIGNKQKQAKGV